MIAEYEKTGVIRLEDLEGRIPPKERFEKGPVAIIECIQEIPCDPCVYACPFKAISMKTLVSTPQLDFNKCTGCGVCARICPGLAIFIVDERSAPKGKAWVTIPYEFVPVPKVGDVVHALNREGKDLGLAKIVRVVPMKKGEKASLVTIEVDEDLAMEARAFRY